MSQNAKLLFLSAGLVLLCQQASSAESPTTGQPPVLAQELKSVRTSGKVMTALWTRRPDSYTLQLVFPFSSGRGTPTRFEPAPSSAGTPNSAARVQVWLLNADGSQARPQSQSIPSAPGKTCGPRCISYEVSYSFALPAAENAMAMAVQINDEFFIDQLQPLGERKLQRSSAQRSQ